MIKSVLPAPNNLPNRLSKVLKQLYHYPMFSTKYLCGYCGTVLIECDALRNHRKRHSIRCRSSQTSLRSNEITEVVTLDIRTALSSIINRNIKILQGYECLIPEADPMNFGVYQHHHHNLRDIRKVRDMK